MPRPFVAHAYQQLVTRSPKHGAPRCYHQPDSGCARSEASSLLDQRSCQFVQVESQFTAPRITANTTKYHHVVANIPPSTASEVRDILFAPPAEDTCSAYRSCYFEVQLHDHRPSQLLRRVQQLAGSTRSLDSYLIGVTASGETDIYKIVELADRFMAVTTPAVVTVLAEALPSPASLEIHKKFLASPTPPQHYRRAEAKGHLGVLHNTDICAGITVSSVALHGNVWRCARSRETPRAGTEGDRCHRLRETVCNTIAVITFGARGDGRDWMPDPDHNFLSWSFALGVIGAFCTYVAAVLFAVDSRRMARKLDEQEHQQQAFGMNPTHTMSAPPQTRA
ncbi:hypothetical protein HPB50_002484 [Hyalomma asiaticum]|uniref:Uncharacterized protein n=1 Tax=Hyalomma asiaticum TaxID=266040 RepID=A0ACB7SJ02_HYAAI|nr:hypothetical protein HPB50_002484 [Hyalomma asiaticum]